MKLSFTHRLIEKLPKADPARACRQKQRSRLLLFTTGVGICSLLDPPHSHIPLFPDAQGCPIPSPRWAHCFLPRLPLSRALACPSVTQKPSHGSLLVPFRHRRPLQPDSPGNRLFEGKEGQETQAEHSKTPVLDYFTCFKVTQDGHLQNSSQATTSDGAELQQQVEKPPRVLLPLHCWTPAQTASQVTKPQGVF